MIRTMRRLSGLGDSPVAEWDTATVSPARLTEIENEFNRLRAEGYFAADITDSRDTIIHKFDADADILMIPSETIPTDRNPGSTIG